MRSTGSRARMGSREFLIRAAVTVVILGGAALVLLNAPGWKYQWSQIWSDAGSVRFFLGGLWVTLLVSLGAMVLAMVLGTLAALMRMSRHIVVNQIGTLYVELVRGTPLLVQILIGYYCFGLVLKGALESAGASVAFVDWTQAKFLWGVLCLGFFAGAYVAEIVRAAIESIDRGQTEAALSQGLTRAQVFRHVLFPQALRRMVPPLTGQFVSLVKDSSLLSVIGLLELTQRSRELASSTYTVFEVYLPLAVLYLVITMPLSLVSRRLELRLT